MTAVRIYVSSTSLDLREYRTAVNGAIRLLDHVDIAMEHYVAEARRPLSRCLEDVRGCDLYVGIFARRYGYVPQGYERSITELEYREARRHGIDVLAFLLDERATWPDEFTQGGEDGRRLAELRAEISRDYLAGIFSSPEELGAIATAAIARAVDLPGTPFDAAREHRLMRDWRSGSSPMGRMRARQALRHMGSPRYAASLKESLLAANGANDFEEIAISLDELVEMGGSTRELLPIVLDLIRHGSAEARRLAIFHLGELGLRGRRVDSAIVRDLIHAAADADAGVRGEIAHTLGKIGHDPETLEDVRHCLETLAADPAPGVRDQATASLETLGP